ncbi:MAG: demethoxyubiquinone hydroxylase family protein [Pseudomonadales bacterium]|nr:demethoxyubiquinone hydroxylase family protein [Pseudomonadales bacterium]MBO6564769.1 demethoxyubiquinone hydroxylase family protein [Pseudomonadales bacterium]MBO6595878.1 demethoxyubiquinone hydroxylase family protein [Pseudomonadales bacterium]MBO6656743.1 demethoxyubiquinone hydroxylase family protein [Pseudomonadales bacterium]MBO6822362.1 demethoxyubiquinone hydroxylase family protein [Pseudomonadales bacterium]
MNTLTDLQEIYSSYDKQKWLIQELRSDHAGETGAIWIYKGILATSRDDAIKAFSQRHLRTEMDHLRLMERLLPTTEHSRLLPVWRIAGFLTGAIPALFGQRTVFLTINAVERFVEEHYQQQIDRLNDDGLFEVATLLEQCMADEVSHQLEAASLMGDRKGAFDSFVTWLVSAGSAIAVKCARLI